MCGASGVSTVLVSYPGFSYEYGEGSAKLGWGMTPGLPTELPRPSAVSCPNGR